MSLRLGGLRLKGLKTIKNKLVFNVPKMQRTFFSHTWKRYEMLVPNVYLNYETEMDLAGIRKSGYLDEIEIKTSVSDFKADFKKVNSKGRNKHEAIKNGDMLCNYFAFLIPEQIAHKCVIPNYAGLYIYHTNNVGCSNIKEVKKAPILHRRKIGDKLKYKMGRKMAYRFWEMKR